MAENNVMSPTRTSSPNRAEHEERFIPELELHQRDACNPVMRVVSSKSGHRYVFYVTMHLLVQQIPDFADDGVCQEP